MILREPEWDDCEFIADCYNTAWPRDKRYFPVDVRNWIVRYRAQPEEKGLVGEHEGAPVGFLLYGPTGEYSVAIYGIVVHLGHQGNGYASAMWRELKTMLVARGTTEATFDALPGLIANLTIQGRFEKIGEGIGEKTGLPTVKGRVTAQMEV